MTLYLFDFVAKAQQRLPQINVSTISGPNAINVFVNQTEFHSEQNIVKH